MNSEALRHAYNTNEIVRQICDDMAERERNQAETKLLRILARLQNNGSNVRKNEAIAAFRLLEESACGQYVEGRHGWPSRFVWSVGSKSACQIAKGMEATIETLTETNEDEEFEAEVNTITHVLQLRSDFALELQLPTDLTQREAVRIASFVAALPLDE
jgi:hypothetical protein